MKLNYKTSMSLAAAMGCLGLAATSAQAAIIVTPSHIQGTPTFAVQGTLAAIDAPTTQGSNFSGPDGPDWPEDADDGFAMDSGYSIGPDAGGRPGWEPDGTDAGSAPTGFTFGTADGTQVSWTFDLPDGAVVHNVYSHWFWQSNSGSQSTLSYDEGTLTTIPRPATNSINNLQLQWTDSAAGEHNINFERVFAGDITVAGGDGFAVTFTVDPDSLEGNVFPYIDAVVIDFTPIPEPSAAMLLGLGGLGVFLRRRRK